MLGNPVAFSNHRTGIYPRIGKSDQFLEVGLFFNCSTGIYPRVPRMVSEWNSEHHRVVF
jgi:hypothetical protein